MLHNRFWQAFFALGPIIMAFLMIFGYLIFIGLLFSQLPEIEESEERAASFILSNIGVFMIFIFFTIVLSLGSLIFYLVHAVQNPNLKQNNLLLLWILLFIFVGGIGQLIYWLVEIVGKKEHKAISG